MLEFGRQTEETGKRDQGAVVAVLEDPMQRKKSGDRSTAKEKGRAVKAKGGNQCRKERGNSAEIQDEIHRTARILVEGSYVTEIGAEKKSKEIKKGEGGSQRLTD